MGSCPKFGSVSVRGRSCDEIVNLHVHYFEIGVCSNCVAGVVPVMMMG